MRWLTSFLIAASVAGTTMPVAAHAATLAPPPPAAKPDKAQSESALRTTTLKPDDADEPSDGTEPPSEETPAAEPAPTATPTEPSPANKAGPASKSEETAPAKSAKQKRPRRPATTLTANIDLTSQRMTVKSDGKTLYTWKISSGARGYDTPTGRFRPKWVARRWHSRKYDMAPMPYSVFFNGGIATHGTTSVRRLGRPASHGCIRLKTANARKFYKLVRKHGLKRTRIVVSGKAKYLKRRYVRRRRATTRSASRRGRRGATRTYVLDRRGRWSRDQRYSGYRGYRFFDYSRRYD